MVKRLRSTSVSSEPLAPAGPSNPAEDDAEAPRKRKRLGDPERGPLEGLPPEIRSQIILELVDPRDLLSSLKNVENLRRTGFTFNRDVAELTKDPAVRQSRASAAVGPALVPQRRNRVLTLAGRLLADSKSSFEDLPVKLPEMPRAEIALHEIAMKCDLISVAGKSEKSDLMHEVLRFPDKPIKYDALDSLAESAAYLEPHDRDTLVESICTLDRKLHEDHAYHYQGSRIHALIGSIKHLSPVAQKKLADAAFEAPDPDVKAVYHEAFATNIGSISVRDTQERIVDAILEHNAYGKAYRVALLAENLDRLSDRSPQNTVVRSPRKKTVHAILDMERADIGRLWAMSKLVEKLDSVNPDTIREVTSVAVGELVRPVVETYDQSEGHTDPVTSRVELAHHLSKHSNLLLKGEAQIVSAFIKDVLTSAGNYREKAQLLPHMDPEARRAFVQSSSPEGNDDRKQIAKLVVEGMAFRVEDLDEKEKENFATSLGGLSARSRHSSLIHVLDDKMPHFTREDASYIASLAIMHCEDNNVDLRGAASTFAAVATHAAELNRGISKYCVRTAAKLTADNVQRASPEDAKALSMLVIQAAQCVANNSRGALVKGMTGLEAKLNTELSDTRWGYDNRPNDLGR